ncbi:MAG TPA: serine hydrolase [Bryobacteraceae bacterium]|nr:serine hydrolase [Bryobacteraceae bacterium]
MSLEGSSCDTVVGSSLLALGGCSPRSTSDAQHYWTQHFNSLKNVLCHTSGLPDIRSREHPLLISFRPGEKWNYTGEGYAYLQSVTTRLTGHVLTSPCGTYELDLKVCGTDFDSYMQTNVLQPLSMGMSVYLWHDRLAGNLVRAHDEQGRPLALRKYTSADAARYSAMGGLLTTATDYARFLIAVMDPKPADAFPFSPFVRITYVDFRHGDISANE